MSHFPTKQKWGCHPKLRFPRALWPSMNITVDNVSSANGITRSLTQNRPMSRLRACISPRSHALHGSFPSVGQPHPVVVPPISSSLPDPADPDASVNRRLQRDAARAAVKSRTHPDPTPERPPHVSGRPLSGRTTSTASSSKTSAECSENPLAGEPRRSLLV